MRTNIIAIIKSAAVIGLILIAILLFPLSSLAITVEEVPNPRATYSWISDTVDILSDTTEAKLNKMISELEAKNGAEIAIVTVEETSPYPSPKAFTTELFNYWGIGKKDVNNGVLYLISVGDRRVEIETGYGLTKILPDETIKNVIDKKITPDYKEGNFDTGTLKGIKFISSYISQSSSNSISSLWINWMIFLALFPFFFILYFILERTGILNAFKEFVGNSSSYYGSWGGDSSSSGSSSGGFGGGSSGGDGAGGSF